MDDTDNAGLSTLFLANARQFLRGADMAAPISVEIALHHMAIALELGLKSLLLSRGHDDDWNRVHIRHDLSLALQHASAAGMAPARPAMVHLVETLSRPYQRHEFHRVRADDVVPALLAIAQDAIAMMLDQVAELRRGA